MAFLWSYNLWNFLLNKACSCFIHIHKYAKYRHRGCTLYKQKVHWANEQQTSQFKNRRKNNNGKIKNDKITIKSCTLSTIHIYIVRLYTLHSAYFQCAHHFNQYSAVFFGFWFFDDGCDCDCIFLLFFVLSSV